MLLLNEVVKIVLPDFQRRIDSCDSNVPNRSISDELFHRQSMDCLRRAVSWLKSQCGVSLFQFKFLVPYINHCSLVIDFDSNKIDSTSTSEAGSRVFDTLKPFMDSKIAIDVNDDNTSLGADSSPFGLESLKRRLLLLQGWDVKIIALKDINQCKDDVEGLAALLIEAVVSHSFKYHHQN